MWNLSMPCHTASSSGISEIMLHVWQKKGSIENNIEQQSGLGRFVFPKAGAYHKINVTR